MYWPSSYQTVFGALDPVASFLSQTGPNATKIDCFNGTGLGCPSKCIDPEWIFGSVAVPSPLWSCMIWPNITDRLHTGGLSDSEENTLTINDIAISLSTANNITSTISNCLTAYCLDLDGCDASNSLHACSANSMVLNGTMLSIDAVGACLATICEYQHQTYANPDIAGIGVVKAYSIQLLVVIISIPAMWCLHLLHWWRIRLSYTEKRFRSISEGLVDSHQQTRLFPFLRGITDFGAFIEPSSRLTPPNRSWPMECLKFSLNASLQSLSFIRYKEEVRNHVRDKFLLLADRLYLAWLAALPELLKAQCFFSLAISIAALVSIKSSVELSVIDQIALWAAGHSGLSPVGIIFSIHSALSWRRPSWYLLLMASTTWIISLYVASQLKFTSPQVNLTSTSQWPDVCANAPPTNMCGTTEIYDLTGQSDKNLKALGIFGIGAGVVTISQLVRLISKKKSEPNHLEDAGVGLSALFFYQLPISCMFFALENINSIVSSLYENGAVNRNWTFGQIVAVTVWLPPLTEFLNTLFDGLPDAHSKLLPAGFEAVLVNDRPPHIHESASMRFYRPRLDSSVQTLVSRRPTFIHPI